MKRGNIFRWAAAVLFGAGLLALPAPVLGRQVEGLTVYFYRDGQAAAATRPGALTGAPKADAEMLLRALLAGPTAAEQAEGLHSALPPGAELAGLAVDGPQATVDLRLPASFLSAELTPEGSDAVVDQVVKTLHPTGLRQVIVRAAGDDDTFRPVSSFLARPDVPTPTLPPNDDPLPPRAGVPGEVEHIGQPPGYGQGRPQGALSGKTVWLSAGHGWYWSETLQRWNTQRPNTYGIVEDFADPEAVNYFLARYLWNAGAEVWLVREHDRNVNEVIVDNDAGAPGYVESGAWTTSGSPGYGGGAYRYATSGPSLTAAATWTPDLPAAGWYSVWAWYRHGANRTTDAHYEIHHAGGVTPVRLSQEVHGATWRWLGDYYFEAGTAGQVMLLNQSDDAGQAVIADAIRFGGGMGSIEAPGGTSGRPRWEEQSANWAEYEGAPADVYDNDVTARPLYAEWETAKGDPGESGRSVFISWHTNAGGGTGSESYIHSFEPTPGSAALQDWVHAELIGDLRAAWDAGWVDRGQKTADFGELRELSTMPGMMLEVAFHDTEDPGDADDLREPVFRQVAARAVAQGITRYFAAQDGVPTHLLPEPPLGVTAINSGPTLGAGERGQAGQITVSWLAPPCCDGTGGDAATSYRVYRSADGRAFDNGVPVVETSLTLNDLAPGTTVYLRVSAVNEGGESFPSPVVAARVPPARQTPMLLVVDGFDRLDQAAMIPQWESGPLGTDRRMFLERMNGYDYAAAHGRALSLCGVGFDGATDEAVEAGRLILASYPAVDWFVGEDSAADASLGAPARSLLTTYLNGGGALLLSGSEIGYDLVELGRDPAFFQDVLHAAYVGDDAETYQWAGVAGGPFAGLAGRFDDSTTGAYDVGYPDRLAAGSGSSVVLSYTGGTADGAALAYAGDYRLLVLGFPLEAVTSDAQRRDVACAAAGFLLEGWEPPPTWAVYLPVVLK